MNRPEKYLIKADEYRVTIKHQHHYADVEAILRDALTKAKMDYPTAKITGTPVIESVATYADKGELSLHFIVRGILVAYRNVKYIDNLQAYRDYLAKENDWASAEILK